MIVYLILFLDLGPFLVSHLVLSHRFLLPDCVDIFIHSVHLTMVRSDPQVLSLEFINPLHIPSSFYHGVIIFSKMSFDFKLILFLN